MKSKLPIYPNELFKSVDDYADFAKKHSVFGAEALAMKRRMIQRKKKV